MLTSFFSIFTIIQYSLKLTMGSYCRVIANSKTIDGGQTDIGLQKF